MKAGASRKFRTNNDWLVFIYVFAPPPPGRSPHQDFGFNDYMREGRKTGQLFLAIKTIRNTGVLRSGPKAPSPCFKLPQAIRALGI